MSALCDAYAGLQRNVCVLQLLAAVMLWEQTLVEGKGAPVWQEWLKSHGGGRSPPEQQCVRPSEPPATLQNPDSNQQYQGRCDIASTTPRRVRNVSCVQYRHYMYSRNGCRCILACCCNLDACSPCVHHLMMSSPQVCLSSLQLLVQLLADSISLREPVERKR